MSSAYNLGYSSVLSKSAAAPKSLTSRVASGAKKGLDSVKSTAKKGLEGAKKGLASVQSSAKKEVANVQRSAQKGLNSAKRGITNMPNSNVAQAVGNKVVKWSPDVLRQFILKSKGLGRNATQRTGNVGLGVMGAGGAALAGGGALAANAMSE